MLHRLNPTDLIGFLTNAFAWSLAWFAEFEINVFQWSTLIFVTLPYGIWLWWRLVDKWRDRKAPPRE